MDSVTIISPRGNEVWGAMHTIAWFPVSDAVSYDIELGNGSTWKIIGSKIKETSYMYDFGNESDGIYAIRVRAFNGWVYGPYGYSNNFTVAHNRPPTKPTNLNPKSTTVDRTQVICVSWKHNSPYSESPQSKFELQYSLNDGVSWLSIIRNTIEEFYYFPANFFDAGQRVYWKVRTFDQFDLASPWSDQAVFIAQDPSDAPIIIEPTDTIPVARPTIVWSAVDQYSYQVQVLEGSIVWDSGEVVSLAKSATVGIDLETEHTYTFRVRIRNTYQLWSDWQETTQLVSYSPPALPYLDVVPDNGYLLVKISNPIPVYPEPEVLYSDLYRDDGNGWIRIATNLLSNAKYRDYNVAANKHYEYKVRTFAVNGTFADSNSAGSETPLRGIWLHDVNDTSSAINIPYNRDIRTTWETNMALNNYAGRTYPIADFGESENYTYTVTITTVDEEDATWWLRLCELIKRKTILCVRDYKGRKVFGVAKSLDESQLFFGNEVPLEISAIEYSEVL